MKSKFLLPIVAVLLMLGFSSCYVPYHTYGARPHYYRHHHHSHHRR